MKIRQIIIRLSISFFLLIAIVLAIGLVGLWRMSKMNDVTQNVTDVLWLKVKLSREALSYSESNNRTTMQVFMMSDKKQINALLDQRAEYTKRITLLLKKVKEQLSTADEKEAFARLESTRTLYVNSYLKALDLLTNQSNPEKAREVMLSTVVPRLLVYRDAYQKFVDLEGKYMDQGGDSVEATFWAARKQLIVLIAIAVALAAGIALFVIRGLAREMSARDRAEQDLRKSHEVLEHRVKERTAELEAAHAKLLDTSRQAGMAEVATGVLHNVGSLLLMSIQDW